MSFSASASGSRRQVLAALSGFALNVARPRTGRAAPSEQVVVSSQGGDYARLLDGIINAPMMRPQGIEVIQDINEEPARVAKLYFGSRLPHGAIDVSSNSVAVNYRLAQAGLLEPLDEDKVPRLRHVLPGLRSPFIAQQFYSPQVLVYNPGVVMAPPQSFGDLLDPRYRGKVGFAQGSYFNIVLAASLMAAGTPNAIERAKPLVAQLNANGLRLYPTIDSVGAAFASGEIVLGIMAMARVVMWRNAGMAVAPAFPREGCITYVSGMVVPRNAPNKANAFRYLDAMAAPDAQRRFAETMGYHPSVDDAALAGPIARQLSPPGANVAMVEPDYDYTTRVQNELADWWTRLTTHD